MKHLTSDEFVALTADLQQHHAVFYQMWEFGKISFSKQVPTAGVCFDKDGEWTEFQFNPDFWDKMTEYQRRFIICHECLHVILNHGFRVKDSKSFQAANVALDVVVNHLLLKQFGFSRDKLGDMSDLLCWTDTVFKGQDIEDDRTFEHYYNLLKKDGKDKDKMKSIDDHSIMSDGDGDGKGEGKNKGKGKDKDGKGQDDKEDENGPVKYSEPEDWEDLIDKLNDQLTTDEKKELQEMIEEHFQSKDGKKAGKGEPGGKKAGTGAGHWVFIDPVKVKKKRKWETVIKKWSRKFDKPELRDVEQWARMNRRMSAFGDGDIMLPSEMEQEYDEEGKINVFFYQDTSGSCWHLKDRFFAAARSLPEDRFIIRMFCFDTAVQETDINSNKIYGGGGTSFTIIEEHIQRTMIKDKIKYPEAIFVITDGYGDCVNPQDPKKWYWFMSDNHTSCIPEACNVFMLKDYE